MTIHFLIANMNKHSYNNHGSDKSMKNVKENTITKMEKLLVTASDKT